jgi:hypothetical protein
MKLSRCSIARNPTSGFLSEAEEPLPSASLRERLFVSITDFISCTFLRGFDRWG